MFSVCQLLMVRNSKKNKIIKRGLACTATGTVAGYDNTSNNAILTKLVFSLETITGRYFGGWLFLENVLFLQKQNCQFSDKLLSAAGNALTSTGEVKATPPPPPPYLSSLKRAPEMKEPLRWDLHQGRIHLDREGKWLLIDMAMS